MSYNIMNQPLNDFMIRQILPVTKSVANTAVVELLVVSMWCSSFVFEENVLNVLARNDGPFSFKYY